jgi:hypothetical protein
MPFLTRCGRRRAVFDPRFGAEPVERLRARRGPPAQAEEAVGERLAPRHCLSDQWRSNGSIGAYRADADRAGAFEVAQTAPSWRHRFKPDGAGRALAAFFALKMRMRTHRVARSMPTNRERRAFGGKTVHRRVFRSAAPSAICGRDFTST